MLSWLCIFHLAVCATQGIKALSKNKVSGPRSPKKLGHPVSFFISLPIFLHSPTSSILKISLDSAEARPRHPGPPIIVAVKILELSLKESFLRTALFAHWVLKGFLHSVVKNPPANAGDSSSIPGWGRSPWKGSGNPLQDSCLENLMVREAWWVCKELDTEWLNSNSNPDTPRFNLEETCKSV